MGFMLQDMATNVASGDTYWAGLMGSDKTKWVFNTQCCATDTYYRMAQCKKPSVVTVV